MDIQFVLDSYSCIMYMLSYISKLEHEMSDFLKNVIKGGRDEAHNAGLLQTQASERSGVCGKDMQLTSEEAWCSYRRMTMP
ncbi:hypothetical protein QQF64_034230 [Cirrhinus molitorella]|uniref:Uncharacterized protein n=1 Tax=Cirrhinus molitorella TaxID=172907 RepID=A0ABR3MW69_9TELE